MRRRLLAIVSSLMLLACQFCWSGETVKVALIAPFTGLGSILGEYIKMGMDIAVDDVNASGGIDGKKLEVVIYDDQANPSTALNVVRKVISDKVVAIFGPNMSSSVLGVHNLAKQAKIPMLVGATSPNLNFSKTQNEYLYRLRANDDARVKAIVKFVVDKLGVKKPGILYGTTDYCTAALAVAQNEFKKLDIPIVGTEQMKEGDKDASGQLLKLKNAGFDCLIGLTHEPEAAIAITQVRQLQIDVPILGFTAWGSNVVTDLAGDAMNGVYAALGFDENDTTPIVANFVKEYRRRNNQSPTDPAQAYHDGVHILAEAIKIAGGKTDGPTLAKALGEVDILAVQGRLKADADHNYTDFVFMARYDGKLWVQE